MKKWQKLLALTSILMLTSSMVFAQVQIRGTVSDKDGNPLPGVSVIIEGTTSGTTTGTDGRFTIQAAVGQTLSFRFIGMRTEIVEITSANQVINITLFDQDTALDEVVVIGYGTQRKQSVVGAIGTTNMDDLKKQGSVSNLTDALTGSIPGVSVLITSGMPGGDYATGIKAYTPSEILIRGKTTWNSAAPLILVDGVERQMNDIDISEVESISVLKDASATAVFGVKGGNGVILITSKRGVAGKTKFKVELENSFETPSKIIEVASVADAVRARNYAIERTRRFNNGLWTELYASDQEIEYYRTGQYPYAYPNQDWHDIMLKDLTFSNRANITASGGTEKVRFFTAVSYSHVGDVFKSYDVGQGYTPAYEFERLNIRSNFDFEITKTTKLTANFYGMFGSQTSPSRNITGAPNGIFPALSNLGGETPIRVYEDGVPGTPNGRFNAANPWIEFNLNGMTWLPRTVINMDYTLTQKLDFITKGLSFVGKLAYDNTFRNTGRSIGVAGVNTKVINKDFYLDGGYYDNDAKVYRNSDGTLANMDLYTTYTEPTAGKEGFGWVKTPNSYYAEDVSLSGAERNLYFQLMMQYNRSFDKHNVTGMAMFSRNQYERGSNWPGKREDWVGRVTYDYDARYFLEANGAYNGSEKFGPDFRFDFFPSIAGGWVISNEQFLENRAAWLDILKVRYSYGLVGNDRVNTGSTWPYLTVWDTYSVNSMESNYYGYPGAYTNYVRYDEGNPGNPNLKWETATKQNLGFEIAAFKNKINLSVDLFNEDRVDMLIGASDRRSTVPPIFGKPAPPANIGKAKSHGAEIVFTYRNSIGNDFDFYVTTNWSVAISEVVFKESTELTLPHQKPEGKPLDQTVTGMSAGFYNSWDDIYSATGAANSSFNGFLLPGDMIMLDFNADGRYNSADDNVPYGYPSYPQNNYGLSFGTNYKGLSFSANFVGAYNATRKIQFAASASSGAAFYFDNTYVPTAIINSTWSPEYNNSNPSYPALALFAKTWNPTGQYYEFDGSFIRLQAVELGYSLPKRWVNTMKIDNLRVYVNGRNLFLWTKMPNDGVGGDDPGFNYPTKKQVNIGVNVQF
ncbi:MAG: SusC/RagA family TonB-linked outer membrane protein [Bacteroidales bacterium]|nr:SusC/RagA family TonB-linked outer membrane protein [Bacteroidales bacterium]